MAHQDKYAAARAERKRQKSLTQQKESAVFAAHGLPPGHRLSGGRYVTKDGRVSFSR